MDRLRIIPALTLPRKVDLSIDEPELRRLAHWLTTFKGIAALMTNGHTGEVFTLTREERAEVTRIVADEVKGKLPVVSAVAAEGIAEAIEQAQEQKAAGATALDIMPPHHWLRFGMRPEHVVDYFAAIGRATGLDLACTLPRGPASYNLDTLAGLARLPWVSSSKARAR